MQVLLDMPNATTNLNSLRLFYDTIATHTRALASLGKSKESYGDILVSIILKKLPTEIRRNVAREQTNAEWTFDELTTAILKEIRVLESGYQPLDLHTSSRSTAAFHVGSKGNFPGSHSGTKKSTACVFCKGPHPSQSCTTITDQPARIDIVKKGNLCFNCLGHHKISQCTSRFCCKKCKKRHHTSLCSTEVPKPNDNRSSEQGGPLSNVPTVPVTTTASMLTSTLNSHSHTHTHTCLLKTAVASIIAGSIKTQANILFDEGAQRLFISADLANELGIQPTST